MVHLSLHLYWALATALGLSFAGIAFMFALKAFRSKEQAQSARIHRLERRLEAARHHRRGHQAVLEAVGQEFGTLRVALRDIRAAIPDHPAVHAAHGAVNGIMGHAARSQELIEAADEAAWIQASSLSLRQELQWVASRIARPIEVIEHAGADVFHLPSYELWQCTARALTAWASDPGPIYARITCDETTCRIEFRQDGTSPGATPTRMRAPDATADLWVAEQWAMSFGGRILLGGVLVIEVPLVAVSLHQSHSGTVQSPFASQNA